MKTSTLIAFALTFACVTHLAAAAGAAGAPAPRAEKKYIPYRITRGDTLTVSILNEPELTAPQKRVDPASGSINLPLVQDVRVHGLTIQEAQEAIAKAYREGRFIRNPVATVTIEVYAPRSVIITGKVNIPGKQEMPADTEWTIKDAIAKAGGFGDTAKGTAVKVTRTLPDGSLRSFTLDVESALKGRATNNDAQFVLEPDDLIYVPEKMI